MHKAFVIPVLIAGLAGFSCDGSPASSSDTAPPWETPQFDDAFWAFWGDGKAEMASYELTTLRYGSPRSGVAVTIFVTETFSNDLRVKADPGKHPASDEIPVMKLNFVKDYPTGIYDYNVMSSTFVALQEANDRPAGSPLKVSHSTQEWCGHMYSQLLFDSRHVRLMAHSYFDGEADQQDRLDYPSGGISHDALWFWVRGLAGPQLSPGESTKVTLLSSLEHSRLSHTSLEWRPATLSRGGAAEQVEVPAGSFSAERWTAEVDGGPTYTWMVESAAPHRILRWESSDGEVAEMIANDRLAYWKLNGPEGIAYLERIGLKQRPPRTP